MKIKYFSIFLVVCSLILSLGGILFAQVTVEDIISRLNRQNDVIRDITAIMEVKFSIMGKCATQSTSIFVKKPNKYKSLSINPPGQIIMSDGQYLYIKLSPGSEMQKRNLDNVSDKSVFQNNPLLGWEDLIKENNVELSKQDGGLYKLELLPIKETRDEVVKKEVWIDYEKGTVTKVVTHYKNITSILQVKDYLKYQDIYLPLLLINEIIMPTGKMISEIKWKDVNINKGISDSEFIYE